VAELALAIAVLRQETGKPLPLRGIAFARLRHLCAAGNQLELSARESVIPEAETAPVALRPEARWRAVGQRRIHPRTPLSQPDALPDRRTRPLPPASSLRRKRCCRIARRCGSRFDPAPESRRPRLHRPHSGALCARFRRQRAGCGAIEAAAQAAAAWEALQRCAAGRGRAARGYLVAMREVGFFTDCIPADQSLFVSVHLEAVSPPLTHYRFEVSQEGLWLVRGAIGTFVAA